MESSDCKIQKVPESIFHKILSKLSAPTLLDCKLISKYWLASINDNTFSNTHFSTAAEDDETSLFLLVFSDWPNPKLELANMMPPNLKTLNNPVHQSVLPEFELVGSCNGILCLYNTIDDDPLYLCNPFSRMNDDYYYKELPKLKLQVINQNTVCRVVFGFGFHPRTKEYKVVKIVYYKLWNYDFSGGNPEAFVLTIGKDDQWRKLGEVSYFLNGPTSEALVAGRLHWRSYMAKQEEEDVRSKTTIISFDLDKEHFQPITGIGYSSLSRTDYNLVNLRGCLSTAVLNGDGRTDIWVMKRYNVEESWTKELVIPSHVPTTYRLDVVPPARRKKNGITGRLSKVLYMFKDGRVLFLYRSKCLVIYDPGCGEFQDMDIQGLPLEFQAFVHLGTLLSLHTICNNVQVS
ncbi:F-box protein At3g07870 [Linum grandiflorum]